MTVFRGPLVAVSSTVQLTWKRSLLVLTALCLLFAYMLSVTAQAETTSSEAALSEAAEIEQLNLEQLLTQIQLASTRSNYQGVFVSSWANQRLIASTITNIYNEDHLSRRVVALDDSPLEVLRTNDQQIQLFPSREVVLSTPIREHEFPGLLFVEPTDISRYYAAQELSAPARVAGVECKKIVLQPLDEYRHGFKLCVEPIKRLLLQIATINDKQEIVSQAAFTQLAFDEALDFSGIETAYDYVNWRHVKAASDEVDLEAEGWIFSLPPGFHKVTSFKLLMGSKEEVRQLTLSDGLASFSVFIQALSDEQREQSAHADTIEGAVNIYSKRLGDYWLTALGAIPIATLEAVVESAKHNTNQN